MLPNPFETVREEVEVAPVVSDEIKKTTCYMCACRCGIRVHLKDGKLRYIEGDSDHPVNRGVLCAKGSAGIMNQLSPARLRKPLLRIGERGEGRFKEIEWEEALQLAVSWLRNVREQDPKKLAFFTGRDQSQSLTGFWAQQFGTPNYAAHGGFCSVNMAAAGLYTLGGSFWEFGEPDWALTRYFMLFGVAEDHDSNPIKMGLGRLKTRGDAKFISVNPVQTGYSAIADEWVPIRPGTDGLFVLALIHELLKRDRFDANYLVRYSNAPWLVIDEPGLPEDGLFARDQDGDPLVFDLASQSFRKAQEIDIKPALVGPRKVAGGRRVKPVFQLIAERYLDPAYAPEAVAARTGLSAARIRRIARELAEAAFEQEIALEQPWTDWAGRRHERTIGRPVSLHAMRGISAHSNGFQTCRALHLLQLLLGSVDVPGGWRHQAPYPKYVPPGPKPAGRAPRPQAPLEGMPLGIPAGPQDLLFDDDGTPIRIDKAFSWDYPLALHGLMHSVIHNAWAGDPYRVEVLFLYMANMAWNSSMNLGATKKYLTERDPETGDYKIPKIIYSDAFHSETVAFADLVLPDTTYLERHDCISLLDRPISDADGVADAIRHPVVKPDRDVRPFQDVLIDLAARLGLPEFVKADGLPKYPGGYADYVVNHERLPGIGPLAGWRGEGNLEGVGKPNPKQLERYIAEGGFWRHELPPEQRYYRHANRDYLAYAERMGFIPAALPIVMQLYSEPLQRFRLAARGHGAVQPPDRVRERIETYFDPLPFWYPPLEEEQFGGLDFPLHAVTQRPMQMYHSWGSQNVWLRQITAENRLYVNDATAARLGLADDDWVWIESAHGRVKGQIRTMAGTNAETVWTWNAIGKRSGAWGLEDKSPEVQRGFLLNHVIADLLPERESGLRYANADPVTGQAAWYDLRVRLVKCNAAEAGETAPIWSAQEALPGAPAQPATLSFGADVKGRSSGRMGIPHREWLGNRDELSLCLEGIAAGHGNRVEPERGGTE
ncbi:MAG: molybdopterin oxidoreductase family protein [Kiloniellales bacterium]